jgi:hypothetical protein
MTSVFGLCHYGSVSVSTLLHFSSPSVFHSPQNCHFVVHFISLHIILLSFMTLFQFIVPLSLPCRLKY